MNTEWLRYYLVLAETLNLQAAADRLHVTPQTISKALAGLEDEFRLRLIDRDQRIRGLTPAGQTFLEEARHILLSMENAGRRMAEWREDTPQGPVRIAGDSVWFHYLLPPLLTELVERFPKLSPMLHEMLPEDVERWVEQGQIDVGLLLRPPVSQGLEWSEGMTTPYVIAGKPQPVKPWQSFGYIVPRIFRRELAESLDGWPEVQLPRRIVAEVELLETAVHLAEAGLGVAFLPELALRERFARGTLAVVAESPVEFSDRLFIVWRKGVRPTPAARAVLTSLGAL